MRETEVQGQEEESSGSKVEGLKRSWSAEMVKFGISRTMEFTIPQRGR